MDDFTTVSVHVVTSFVVIKSLGRMSMVSLSCNKILLAKAISSLDGCERPSDMPLVAMNGSAIFPPRIMACGA